jgi:hypothetical protein
MSNSTENKLRNVVICSCDNLYASRQLITLNSVKNTIQLYGDWSQTELDAQLPAYINEWRLKNLAEEQDQGQDSSERVKALEIQLSHYRTNLTVAQGTIAALKLELRRQRTTIINELRSMLHASK